MKNIAVISGGYSSEVIVSVKSAKTVFNHIDKSIYKCLDIYIYDLRIVKRFKVLLQNFILLTSNTPITYITNSNLDYSVKLYRELPKTICHS